MLHKIPFKLAGKILTVLSLLVCLYHLLILTGIISYTIAWGGQLKNERQMLVFEAISLVVNFTIIFVVAVKTRFTKIMLPYTFVQVMLWFFSVLFFLNTLGNLFAKNKIETLIFTPITLISAILFLRLAMERSKPNNSGD